MKVVVFCPRPPQNMHEEPFHVVGSPAVTAKKCTKKRVSRAELLFCHSKHIAVLVDVVVVA